MAASEPLATRTTHEVDFDTAVAIAIKYQQNGYLTEAADIYRQILAAAPDFSPALHYSGVLAHQQGHSDDAIRLIERSLTFEPDRADYYSNLGIVLRAVGRIDDAIAAYQRAIDLAPAHANAYSNLGVLLNRVGRFEEAEKAFRTAIEMDAAHVEAHNNLGVVLSNLGRLREAVICYCQATVLDPAFRDAHRLLANAYCELGETDKAIEVYNRWIAEEPDDPVPRHLLAACTGFDVPARASDEFVEKIFDSFAASFDRKLTQLKYQAPQITGALLADTGCTPAKALDILDAGCGTGLCAPLLAPYARTLIGVDLSAAMLTRAAERGGYDELVKAELTEYLRRSPERFDVIVSADTLVYFGALDDAFAAAAVALRPEGWLIFTLEEAQSAKPGERYRLPHHGRYEHSREYVEQALAAAGLKASIDRVELRMESGTPVAGLAVRAQKRGLDAAAQS
jgi:pentatricopeptide repeat protein